MMEFDEILRSDSGCVSCSSTYDMVGAFSRISILEFLSYSKEIFIKVSNPISFTLVLLT